MSDKPQREIIKFPNNADVTLEIDTEPSMAKEGSRTTKAGKQQFFWTYFTKDGRVFFADKSLHTALQGFHKGDSVIITNVVAPGAKWGSFKATSVGHVERAVGSHDTKVDEILENTRKILSALNVQTAPKVHQNPPVAPAVAPESGKAADLGF